ncbi:MAG: Phosphoserine phosphatase RsbU [Chlamydiae bacterium]|nr:Phosphoserine phosphatase RsbU [Chlamydiota bacterium]
MIPFRKSLAFRILGISIILLALPLLVDSFILVQKGYRDAIKDAKEHLIEKAYSKELPLKRMQPVKRPMLVLLENFLNLQTEFPDLPKPEVDTKLAEIAAERDFIGIFLLKLNDEGRLVVINSSIPGHEGRDFTHHFQLYDIYSEQTKEQGYINLISYDVQSSQPFILVARVVYSEAEQKPLGVLMVAGEVGARFETLLIPDEEHFPVDYALLLPDTVVFAASDPDFQFQYFAPIDKKQQPLFLKEGPQAKDLLPEKPLVVLGSKDYPFFRFIWNGEEQIGFIKKIMGNNISLLTYASKKAVFEQPMIDFLSIYGVYALILISGSILAFFLTKRMSRPMQNLSYVMGGIQAGHLEMRYKEDPLGYEINQLGMIFNEMVDTLLQKQRLAEEERVKRERYAKELLIGREVQRSLLPEKMPKYPGVDLAEVYLPAKEVGGDFYDVFIRGEKSEELVLAIADASGKGVRACFYSLDVRSMLRTYAQKYEAVQSVLANINKLFCQDTGDTGMFVTALVGFYNHESRTLRYYSAGHNPLLIRRANGETTFVDHLGAALGIEVPERGGDQSVQLASGDVVVFYTDGITEAHNEQNKLFGEERLVQLVKASEGQTPSEMIAAILKEVEKFVGDAPQHDDITMLIMKVQ